MTIDWRDPQQLQDYRPALDLLNGRTLLITGAGDGIGKAVALACARHGARVILLGRTVEKLERVYDEIAAQGSPEAVIMPMDLASCTETDYAEVNTAIVDQFGALDGLLHNAGLLGRIQPLAQTTSAQFRDVLQVNLLSNFELTRALLPSLEASDDASVLFSSSSVGRQGRAYWGAYAISKFATEGMMQVWADELAGTSNIRVNTINPGATNTAMRRSAYPAEQPANNPDPADIVGAYLFLLGPDSREVTGQQLDARPRQ